MHATVKTPQPMQIRRAVVAIAALALLGGWCLGGGKIIAEINPGLKRELAVTLRPPLDVWITPPGYADAGPIIISTPAGVRYDHKTLTVPAGSTISAHLAEQGGDTPDLVIDGSNTAFTTDSHGDFAATAQLTEGDRLSIRRGWLTLASWKIHVVPNAPPQVAMTAPPALENDGSLRIAYSASDALGLGKVALRVTPSPALPGENTGSIDIALPSPQAATQISHTDFLALADQPWTGHPVSLQIVATSASGQSAASAPVAFTLPAPVFAHPVARILIEERNKLMKDPEDEKLRLEVANIMAGVSQEAAAYHADPVLMMALRSGAVRLILNDDRTSAVSVNNILWESALRIENGGSGKNQAQRQTQLHNARQDLADAIDHNADAAQIRQLTDRLQQAITGYVTRMNTRPTR
ncbi:MAG: DUF4175 family protein [Alphaproteobacteria bacterium]|nr:DUF4175 family protein [Alphaproteobacteria bacterium]